MAYKNDKTKNRRRYKSRYRSAHNYKPKRSSSTKAGVLVSVLTFLVIACVVVVFTFGDSIYESLDGVLSNVTETEAPTQPPTEKPTKPTEKPTQPPTEKPTKPKIQQEEQYNELLKMCKLDPEDIKVDQMIFVDTDNENLTCKVYCYERGENGVFKQEIGPFDGYIGSEGVSRKMSPTEYKTPAGLFKIEYAFGTKPEPGTKLKYSQFTTEDYWITDPNSAYYNRWMYGTQAQDWTSAQWLYEYTISYPYAIVFEYNRSPVDKTQGCAKFIHVSDTQTKGGIGVSLNHILSMLYWLDPSQGPYIAIAK